MTRIIPLIATMLLVAYSTVLTYKYVSKSPDYIVIHDTIAGDSVFVSKTIYKPYPYEVLVYDTDTIQIPADTAELVKRYKAIYSRLYTSKTYLDTVKNVSEVDVVSSLTISQNSVDSLKIYVKNNRPTAINTTVITNEVTFKAGVMAGYKSVTPIISYKVNNKFNALGGYDIYNKSFQLGVMYNIK